MSFIHQTFSSIFSLFSASETSCDTSSVMEEKENISSDSMTEKMVFEQILSELSQDGACSLTPDTTSPLLNTQQWYNMSTKYHLILDIDGTLVHTVGLSGDLPYGKPDYSEPSLNLCSYKRPGLDKFIEFCFTHFVSVSLWTAGSQPYAEYIARSLAPSGRDFLFVLSRDHCSEHPSIDGCLVKDMNNLWKSDAGKEFNLNSDNTFIIDDNENYCDSNIENAIIISTWKCLYADSALSMLVSKFTLSEITDTVKSMCFNLTFV